MQQSLCCSMSDSTSSHVQPFYHFITLLLCYLEPPFNLIEEPVLISGVGEVDGIFPVVRPFARQSKYQGCQ